MSGIASAAQQMAARRAQRGRRDGEHPPVVEESTARPRRWRPQAGEVATATQSIAAIAEENSAATEEVLASAEEMGAQVDEVTAQAEELARTAEQLQELVARFHAGGAPDAEDHDSDEWDAEEDRPFVARRRPADWATAKSEYVSRAS